jgi:O-antigen/teichoic acid export membrane protein
LQFVLAAYLVGKIILGLGLFVSAQIQLRRALGKGWSKASIYSLPSFRELFKFAFSSNLSATLILIFRESEILWVGYFLSSEAAGYYKAAYAIVLLLALPVQPLVLTVYPELNRLVVQKAWPRLRDFLRKVTLVAFGYNLILGLGMIFLGRWLLWLYGGQYMVAYPALMALLVGMVFNFTLFWNRPLLLSFNMPTFPLWATLIAGLLKMGMAFLLVPRFGYVMEAALLSFYYIISVGLMVARGLQEIKHRESLFV